MYARASLGVTFVLLLLLCSGVSAAEENDAEENDAEKSAFLFDRGVENMQAKNYEVACSQIAESVRLERRPGALYTLARCEEERGRIATAMAIYDEFMLFCETLSSADKTKQSLRLTDSKLRLKNLKSTVPHLTISLSSNAPANTEVRKDGKPFSQKELGVRVPVDPGVHVLTTQVGRGPVQEKRIEIAPKTDTILELTVITPYPPSNRRIVGWSLIGAGGAFLGGGLISGAIALSKVDIIERNCGRAIGLPLSPAKCNNTGFEALESANIAATLSTIGVAIGAVGVAGGIFVLATKPNPPARKTTSLLHDVTFDLRPMPLGGGMVGVHGAW